jgi:FKBP-type peptidyl-prolyl cis-trans isomerase FkpA
MSHLALIVLLNAVLFTSPVLTSSAWSSEDELAAEKKASAEYLAQMASESGAQVIEQGIVMRSLFEAHSPQFPIPESTVQVSYLLTDREGKLIEESLSADQLAEFPLPKLIRCWQIALPKISVGSFYKVTCPADTAYGDKGAGGGIIKPGAAITFRVTLFGLAR